jgi:hypothetical protein
MLQYALKDLNFISFGVEWEKTHRRFPARTLNSSQIRKKSTKKIPNEVIQYLTHKIIFKLARSRITLLTFSHILNCNVFRGAHTHVSECAKSNKSDTLHDVHELRAREKSGNAAAASAERKEVMIYGFN